MKLHEMLREGQNILCNAGITEYESDVKSLAMYALEYDYSGLMLHMLDDVSDDIYDKFISYVNERSQHKPCQYITGEQWFMGYQFHVEPGVLIPRPETELLVERAVSMMEAVDCCKALDVCCGSGCIGISFSLLRQGNKHPDDEITLLDISDKAIEVSNFNNITLAAKCSIIKSDLFDEINEKYDIIMSNPPYICTADIEELESTVKDFEPRLALDGMEDGLFFYKRIIMEARNYLNDKGKLLFEIGYNQFEDVRRLLVDAGYIDICLIKDYSGLDRIVSAGWNYSV